jgi:hypothetical protein
MISCRVLGHRPRFEARGSTLYWECERGCGEHGEKTYPTEAQAQRYARAFDRRDSDDFGKRAPLFAMLPLRLARAMRGRSRPAA